MKWWQKQRPILNCSIRHPGWWMAWAVLGLCWSGGSVQANYGQVKQVKGGTVQRINQERHLNKMLMLDDIIFERDLIKGDHDAQAVIQTVDGQWYLGKDIELQLSNQPRPLITIIHGQFKVISSTSLHKAPPIRVGDLEIQFMHKFGLVEEGHGPWEGTWLINGQALLKLYKKPEVERFELAQEDLLINYNPTNKSLAAYPIKRAKFLRTANNESFWRDYLVICANEVFDAQNFAAVTPTPTPIDNRIIKAPQDLKLSEGEEQKVNLNGDPDAFLQEYFQQQLAAQKATLKNKAKKKKAKK